MLGRAFEKYLVGFVCGIGASRIKRFWGFFVLYWVRFVNKTMAKIVATLWLKF